MAQVDVPRTPQNPFGGAAATVVADLSLNAPACALGTAMLRPLGPLQNRLLAALLLPGRDSSLQSPAALAAGLIPDLETRPPYGRVPRRATYVATARAVAVLRRRGLVDTLMAGTAKGRLEWPQGAPPVWRFRHPGKRLILRPLVDSLVLKS